jgi:hypothetical protein
MQKFWEKLYLRKVYFHCKSSFKKAERPPLIIGKPYCLNWKKLKKQEKMKAKKHGMKVVFLNDRNFMKAMDIWMDRSHIIKCKKED